MNISFNEESINKFWANVEKTSSCWVWKGRFTIQNEYGRYTIRNGINCAAHILAYLISKGDYNEDLIIHHRCNNKKCINPKHLGAITQAQNAKYSYEFHHNFCPEGHEYNNENTIFIKLRTFNFLKQCILCTPQEQKERELIQSKLYQELLKEGIF